MMRKGCERFVVPVESLDTLPEPVAAVICQHVTHIRQMILIPAQEFPLRRLVWRWDLAFGWRKTPRRTVVLGDDQLLVVHETDPLTVTQIPLADLAYIHITKDLLYAVVELGWNSGGEWQTVTLEHTLVGHPLVRRLLDMAREQSPAPVTALALADDLPFKFRNYLQESLLPDEHVCGSAYQPGRGMTAITEQNLIRIVESRGYGIHIHFYALNHVEQMPEEQAALARAALS
jgi:hypothetical protein